MNYDSSPLNNYIGNNIIVNCNQANIIIERGDPSNTWEGNISYPSGKVDVQDGSQNAGNIVYSNADPNLIFANGLYKLTSTSTNAIDQAVGSYGFITDDLEGGFRSSNKDIGADEYGVSGARGLLSPNDVGPLAGN
jgi:hypothetical protein